MGLFDKFKSEKGQDMSPHKALTVSMLYIIAADGEIDSKEIGQLLSVIGGENRDGTIVVGGSNPNLVKDSLDYVRKTKWPDFLSEISQYNVLNEQQKMYICINMLDSSLSDGTAEPQENEMILKFLQAFGISQEKFKPYYEAIAFKNSRKIFNLG